MKRLLLIVLIAVGASSAETITRATAHLNGVTSPRGFFNITVRLYQLPGVAWAKYDLRSSMLTLDFEPGAGATPEQIQAVMKAAGYKPGAVQIGSVEKPDSYDHRLGWNPIRRPKSKNALARWFELNF